MRIPSDSHPIHGEIQPLHNVQSHSLHDVQSHPVVFNAVDLMDSDAEADEMVGGLAGRGAMPPQPEIPEPNRPGMPNSRSRRYLGLGGGSLLGACVGAGSAPIIGAMALAPVTGGVSLLAPALGTAVAALGGGMGYLLGGQYDQVANAETFKTCYMRDHIDNADFNIDLARVKYADLNSWLTKPGILPDLVFAINETKKTLTDRLRVYLKGLIENAGVDLSVEEHEVVLSLVGNPDIKECPNYRTHARVCAVKMRGIGEIHQRLQQLLSESEPRSISSFTPYEIRLQTLEALLTGKLPALAEARDLAWRIGKATLFGTVDLAKSFLAGSAMKKLGAAQEAVNQQQGWAVSGASQRTFESIMEAIYDQSMSANERLKLVHAIVIQMSRSEVTLLPKSIQRVIGELDDKISDFLRNGGESQHEVVCTLLRRRQGPLMSFPVAVQELAARSIGVNIAELTAIDLAVRKLVEEYPHIADLPRIINQIRDNSRQTRPGKRVQIFLAGAPGTGKTRFAKRLADALLLPLRSVQLDRRSDFQDLLGQTMNSSSMANKDTSDLALLSKIPYELTVAGCKNAILFFEESGEVLSDQAATQGWGVSPSSSLKKLLDPGNEQREISVPGLGPDIRVDFSHATIIMTGNSRPTNTAIRDRLTIVEFPPVPHRLRRGIALGMIDEERENIAGMPDTDWNVMRALATSYVDLLWAIDKDSNCPGMRPMERAVRGMMALIRGQMIDGEPLAKSAVEQCIKQEYAQEKEAQQAQSSQTVAPRAPSYYQSAC